MEEAVNKKADESKKKKRTSLKSILGGDILATDFFRRQTKLLVLIMVFLHPQPLRQSAAADRDRPVEKRIDRY